MKNLIGKAVADKLREIIPEIVRNWRSAKEIDFKKDRSIVTATDRQVEALLIPELARLAPQASIVGEESAPVDPIAVAELFERESMWAIDPIDGTINFAAGLPMFAVSVGLLARSADGFVPAEGIVSFPALGEIYYTGGGQIFRRIIGQGDDVPVDPVEESPTPILLMSSFLAARNLMGSDNPFAKNFRRFGCTVANLTYVGIGKASATFTRSHIWDFAAGLAIARNAGLVPRVISSGKEKAGFSMGDFSFGELRNNWRIKAPLVLCKDEYFDEVTSLVQDS